MDARADTGATRAEPSEPPTAAKNARPAVQVRQFGIGERRPPAEATTAHEIPTLSEPPAPHEPRRVASKIETLRPAALHDDMPSMPVVDIDDGWEESIPPSFPPAAVPLPPPMAGSLRDAGDVPLTAPVSVPLAAPVTMPSAFPWPSLGKPLATEATGQLSPLAVIQQRAIRLLLRIASAVSAAPLFAATKHGDAAAKAHKQGRTTPLTLTSAAAPAPATPVASPPTQTDEASDRELPPL